MEHRQRSCPRSGGKIPFDGARREDLRKVLQRPVCPREAFSLVELMVVVAIVAILAAVAVPAYVNHVRRSEQAQAVEALLRARMELEAYWADHNRYAATLRLLPSFESGTQGKYVLTLKTSPDGQRYRVEAVRPDVGDKLHLADNETHPVVETPKALGWSLFQWLLD